MKVKMREKRGCGFPGKLSVSVSVMAMKRGMDVSKRDRTEGGAVDRGRQKAKKGKNAEGVLHLNLHLPGLPLPLPFHDVERLLADFSVFYAHHQLRHLRGGRGAQRNKGSNKQPPAPTFLLPHFFS